MKTTNVFLVAVLSIAAGVAPATAGDGGACTKTATAAAKACKGAVIDDFWTAIANCHNELDFKTCKEDAEGASDEGETECADLLDARLLFCEDVGEERYDPEVDPATFVDPADIGDGVEPNPYFLLVPGRKMVYENEDATITVTVTGETREILGVTCAEVQEEVEEDDELVEDTLLWFAQDVDGNVWFFGEIAQQLEDGVLVSIEGSWTAGVDGAKPGLAMEGAPAVGDVYREGFALGAAEDAAEVLSLTGSEESPAASCNRRCLLTEEFSPISEGFQRKHYAPGVGLIVEVDTETGERVELQEVGDAD